MTLKQIWLSVRLYGIKGILNYLIRQIIDCSARRQWQKRMVPDPNYKPEHGITVIGCFSSSKSLSKVLRDLVFRLQKNNIPYQAFDTGCDNPIPSLEFTHLLTPPDQFKLNRYSDIVGMFALPSSLPQTSCRCSRIGFWEFESGLCEALPLFLSKTEVICTSDFDCQVFRNQISPQTAISKILYPFQFETSKLIPPSVIRDKYNLGQDDFLVFFNFDYMSSYYRKYPDGVVKAFANAFKTTPHAKLIFKTMGAKARPLYVQKLKNTIIQEGIEQQVIFIDHFMPQDELVGLTNACDVYISLHRGEGFGLGIAEAMSLGKAVIVTNYSAPTEFCNETNAMLVPYKMVNVLDHQRDEKAYQKVKSWAEPDLSAATQALRKLYQDPNYRQELGRKAQEFITDYFSDANFVASINRFLDR